MYILHAQHVLVLAAQLAAPLAAQLAVLLAVLVAVLLAAQLAMLLAARTSSCRTTTRKGTTSEVASNLGFVEVFSFICRCCLFLDFQFDPSVIVR